MRDGHNGWIDDNGDPGGDSPATKDRRQRMSEEKDIKGDINPEDIGEILADIESAAKENANDTSASEGDPSSDVGKLQAEIAELKDKNLRLYAEFDNFRRRSAKESFDLMATASAKLLGKLTEVLENFHRAFDAQGKGSTEDFEKGVKLIFGRFKEILDAEGLEEIDPVGAEFDPNLHEALLQQHSETVPENRVIQVIAKGYKLKGKILKHAKVIVSQGKA
jgi:molecular chaperone GrpE